MTSPTLIRPMLAKRFEPRFWSRAGMYVQPKLNGVRAMYQNGVFMSRDGIPWAPNCLTHIRKALVNLPPQWILDGELYRHGMSLQQINSHIAVSRVEPHPDEALIAFWVFDVVEDTPFYVRHDHLILLVERCHGTAVVCVPTYYSTTLAQANSHFLNYKTLGYEGAIYRAPDMPYATSANCGNKENRVSWLLKHKEWLDLDAVIVSVDEGAGRFLGTCGSLTCVLPNGNFFSAGSGLTDRERETLWTLRETVPGWPIKIRYEMLSDSGIPLKPTIIQVPNLYL